ncbi:hypothetical protein P8627_09445 [Jannaschia sp. GRR-S6-38]|uniref:Tetratricopeptide repeat protein n=1 Tax=Jannaschia ovalis TaxID=3038773 RepID=A0ABY8L7C6_9RHOB|nr:hypothetical protein [Jannaschia sp. GRR-S6-38]WGH77276.1 hypothetical protein P8627_09445 [Jannaschia sp. GRR-S6-38]
MTVRPFKRLAVAASVAVVLLSGCQSDEARIDELFASAEAFVEDRDFARALIQYRNILKIDGDHAETRIALGRMFLSQGYLREAAREYTLLSERQPDRVEWRFALGQIAVMQTDWDALRRHADIAEGIAPDASETAILRHAVAFRDAMRENDPRARDALAETIAPLRAARPDEPVMLRIALEAALDAGREAEALAILDDTLGRDPYRADLQVMRIRLLADDGREDPVDQRLMELVALYPSDPEIVSMLVARHMSQGRVTEAGQVLRALTDGAPADDVGARAVLVRFLLRTQGPDAALAELARQREAAGDGPGARLYAAMERAIRFDTGERAGAIDGLRTLLAEGEEGGEARMIRVLLARMLDRQGERREARAEVETVLGADPGEVGALKLRAGWAIEAERPKDAIVDLRSALSQSPRDTDLLNLMAAAHSLDGNPGLAMEQLAQAAQVSGHAAAETERYARALIGEGRDRLALRVLQAAQDAAPGHLGVSRLLGELHIDAGDWGGALQAAAHIDRIPGEAAAAAAASLRAGVALKREPRRDGLGDLYDPESLEQPALTRAVSELIAIDEAPLALSHIETIRAEYPDAPALALIRAELLGLTDRLAEAAGAYEALLDHPELAEAATLRLFGLKAGQQDLAGATAVLARGLRDHPDLAAAAPLGGGSPVGVGRHGGRHRASPCAACRRAAQRDGRQQPRRADLGHDRRPRRAGRGGADRGAPARRCAARGFGHDRLDRLPARRRAGRAAADAPRRAGHARGSGRATAPRAGPCRAGRDRGRGRGLRRGAGPGRTRSAPGPRRAGPARRAAEGRLSAWPGPAPPPAPRRLGVWRRWASRSACRCPCSGRASSRWSRPG